MRHQVDLMLPAELPFFIRDLGWRRAKTVLDIGTGNSYYLLRLAEFFPEKSYTGIDVREDHIKVGRRYVNRFGKDGGSNVHLVASDFTDYSGKFDAVIARLCIQHLESMGSFLKTVRRNLNEGGVLVIVESNDSDRIFLPQIVSMVKFFETLRTSRSKAGFDRDAGEHLKKNASRFGLEISQSCRVTSTSAYPGFKELFFGSYSIATRIAEEDFKMPFDYTKLRRDLTEWYNCPRSYTQLSLNMASYRLRE
ncbi:MAG: class I SAM-dependent methyltransferase, partial [Nitrososphaera sp.]|nr:class I SAM-dependent methyltransferase [Nitrososphaera sp.]